MIERPSDEQIYKELTDRRSDWLSYVHDCEVAILGGGVTALFAGSFLEARDCRTVILESSEYLGGSLNWQNGPVPVYAPAHEQLTELDYSVDDKPPVWIDRNDFLSRLIHVYLDRGGFILRRVFVGELPSKRDGIFQVFVEFEDLDMELEFDDLIVSSGEFSVEGSSTNDTDPMEGEILNTERTDERFVRAGRSTLTQYERESTLPLESAHLLSGRKAAEIVLNSPTVE